MTQTPAGWHPDPHVPGQQRYWDGASWTDQVAPLSRPEHSAYGGPGYAPAGGTGPATTPDGQPLAGWWRRVGAALIDGIVMVPIGVVLAFPWYQNVFSAYSDYFRDSMDAAEAGRSAPSATSIQGDVLGDILVISLISIAVNFAYNVGFLLWKQATLGKLAVGTRVRLRETPGPLPLRTVLLRWLTQFGPSSLGAIPLVGTLGSLYYLLDSLWPLWDKNNQALHDKAAGTNVVLKS